MSKESNNKIHSLVIRKDVLEKILAEHNLTLFWISLGEKQSFLGDGYHLPRDQKWSSWSGNYVFDNGMAKGKMLRESTDA